MEKIPHIAFLFDKLRGQKYPVFAENRIYEPGYDTSLHCHDFPQIWFCRSGRCIHQIGEQEFGCTKGSVVIIPAGVYHCFKVPQEESCEMFGLHLSYEFALMASVEKNVNMLANMFLPPFEQALGYPLPLFRMISNQSLTKAEECLSWLSMLTFAVEGMVELHQIYEKLEQLFSAPEFTLPTAFRKKALDLIHTRIAPIVRVVSYLNVHYPDKITEDTILRGCGISRAGLYRYFKQVVGHTYSQYLQQLRVKRAYFYVKFTTYSFRYISDICGFFDIHHMSRLFTKYIGESPRQRRIHLREMYR